MRGVVIYDLEIKSDERGWLSEVIKRDQLTSWSFGRFYVTTAYPGVIRGNHYHHHMYEWFCVIKGRGRLVLVDNETGERKELLLGEEAPVTVRIPPGIAHGIENVGQELMYLLVYSDTPFQENAPDTHVKVVIDHDE